jgi:hypothetical protein
MSISLAYSQPASARWSPFNPLISVDFDKAVQAAVLARSTGATYRHQYAKLAEAVLVEALPMYSSEIRTVGARKGKSGKIGKKIATQLSAQGAAALAALWSVRNARLAGMYQVFHAAAHKPGFGSTMVRILGQTEVKRLIWRIQWRGAIRP